MIATAPTARTASTLTGRRPAARHPITDARYRTVGAIVEGTTSHNYLGPYAAKLGAEAAVANMGLVLEYGAEGALSALHQAAVMAYEKNKTVGLHVHQTLRAYARWHAAGQPAAFVHPALPAELARTTSHGLPIRRYLTRIVKQFANAIATYRMTITAVDLSVYNEDMAYTGEIDFIAVALIDGKMRRTAFDFTTAKEFPNGPAKLAALRRATAVFTDDGERQPAPRTQTGAVLQLFADDFELTWFRPSDDRKGWTQFRRAEALHSSRRSQPRRPGAVAARPGRDGLPGPVALSSLEGRGYGRAPAALRGAGFATVADLAGVDLAVVKGIGPATLPDAGRILTDYPCPALEKMAA